MKTLLAIVLVCGLMLLVRPAWAQDTLGLSEHVGMRVLRGAPSAPTAAQPESPTAVQHPRETFEPSEVLDPRKEEKR